MPKVNTQSLEGVVERLHTSEKCFRLFVESVEDYALFMLDPVGRVTSWNRGAERINGYRASEVVGRHFSHFYMQEDIDAGKPDTGLQMAIKHGRFADEGWRRRKDGARFWASVVITALHDEHGRLRGFGKVTRDLSERMLATERLKASELQFQSFMEHSPSLMFMKSIDGRYLYVNTQFCRSFGLESDAILGHSDAEIFKTEQATRFQANDARVIASGTAMEFEEIADYSEGRRRSIVCKFPIRDAGGRITALGGVVTDITERNHLASPSPTEGRALRATQHPAAVEPTGTMMPMQRGHASPQASKEELTKLVQLIACDLRPPLRNIEALTAQVLEGMADMRAMATRLDLIARSAGRLTRLTGDLLAYSRSASLSPSPHQAADLEEIVAQARMEIIASQGTRNIQWKIGALPIVPGDPALLGIALAHLLSNAVKFTRTRNPALIEVSASQDAGGGALTLVIKDNGQGFDPRLMHKLFVPFQRLHDNSQFEGVGIGLATAKRIIECHGGRIRAESQQGEGAQFFISLPATEACDTDVAHPRP